MIPEEHHSLFSVGKILFAMDFFRDERERLYSKMKLGGENNFSRKLVLTGPPFHFLIKKFTHCDNICSETTAILKF